MAQKTEKSSYQKMLDDPRWQRRRLEVLKRAKWTCEDCGDDKSMLHVHHRIYLPRHEPWDYPEENFVACCESCHEKREAVVAQSRAIFQIISPGLAKSFLDKLASYRGDVDVKVLELNTYMALDLARKVDLPGDLAAKGAHP